MSIGERIHRQPKRLGLSLRELGTRTDLTTGFLSRLENDQLSPSLNSLQAIATALQVPLFYFKAGLKLRLGMISIYLSKGIASMLTEIYCVSLPLPARKNCK